VPFTVFCCVPQNLGTRPANHCGNTEYRGEMISTSAMDVGVTGSKCRLRRTSLIKTFRGFLQFRQKKKQETTISKGFTVNYSTTFLSLDTQW
jgi:hypothetical protein